jgi:uncharacterized membrane protein YqjE
MQREDENQAGLFGSFRRLLNTGFAIAQNRLELLLVELQEERWHLLETLLLIGTVLILAAMTLAVVTVTIVVLCLRNNRLDLVIALIVLYLIGTVFASWRLLRQLKGWVPFSDTLAELKKDKACLEQRNEND